MPVFALCDANNFYCSCERAFNPALRNVPVVVLSNNDGCCIARSQEAKALGIKMGDPWFKIAEWAEAAGVRKFSSNYTLYGDMSRRMYDILCGHVPVVEPYSIDEMFLDLSGMPGDMGERCQAIRADVRRNAKIPTCIGIGETKTKAKLANHVAKTVPHFNGVCDLRDPETCRQVYQDMDIEEVWGIGGATADKLYAIGIRTIAQLVDIDIRQARGMLTVVGARTVNELRGVSCLPLSLVIPDRKGLAVTRTFGRPVTDWHEMAEAISTYATRAAEKLREQGMIAGAMQVFMQTNRFFGQWYNNASNFDIEPTNDTRALVADALRGARPLWRQKLNFWKAGVVLSDLSRASEYRQTLFATRDKAKSDQLMAAIDKVNQRYGRGALRLAVTGVEKGWKAKSEWHSPRYTTHVDELMVAL